MTLPLAIPASSAMQDAGGVHVVSADTLFHANQVSVARAIGELLQVVRETLDLEVVFIGEFSGGRRFFRHLSASMTPALIALDNSQALEYTICQRILDGRLPALIPNMRELPHAQDRLPPGTEMLTAYIGVPVHLPDGRLYGMLCGFSLLPHAPLDERALKRLEVAATAAARLLAQADGSTAASGLDAVWG